MLLFHSSTWSSKESFSYQLFEKLEPSVGHGELYLCMLSIAMIWTGSPIRKTLLLFKELLAVIALPSTEVSAAFWLPGCLTFRWFIVLTEIGWIMCFPNDNSTLSCNPPLCSAWVLGCYFLSHIYLGLPCFLWVSRVSPVSSGSFACVPVASHCCAKCRAFRFSLDYWAALHMWLQSCSLTRTSRWQGLGDSIWNHHVQFYPPSARHQQNGTKCSGWMTTERIKELECRIKKAERLDLFSLEKRRQSGILLPLFTWLQKDIVEMEWGLSHKCTILEQEEKDTSYRKKNSSSERKPNSPGRCCSTKTGPRVSVDVHHWRH